MFALARRGISHQASAIAKGVLLVIALTAFVAQPTHGAEISLEMRMAAYHSSMTQIQAAFSNTTAKISNWYMSELTKLQTTFQKAGKLEAWESAKREIERVQEDGVSGEPAEEAPKELKALHDKFRKGMAKAELDKSKKTVTATKTYLAQLEALKKQLTIAGRMEEASAANEEIENVGNSEAFTSAIDAMSTAEAEKAERMAARAETASSGPVPATTVPPLQKGTNGVTIAKMKSLPVPDGLSYRTLRMIPSETAPSMPQISVSCQMAKRESMAKSSAAFYGYVEKSKSGATEYFVRLNLKTTKLKLQIEGATVVTEYFAKNVSDKGRIDPVKIKTIKARVPPLESTVLVWVDLPAVSTQSAEHKETNPRWGHNYSYAVGQELYGVVVSVFSADGTVLHRLTSNNALRKFASSERP